MDLICKVVEEEEYGSDDDAQTVLENLAKGVTNKYWYLHKVNKYPSWVIDPVVGCPTCMPSLHTLICYTIITRVQGWHWNPLVWVLVAMLATYPAEMLWKLRSIVDKLNKKLN
jgi:hypothetical protein